MDLVFGERDPQLFKFNIVLFNIVRMVNNQNILLVVRASLIGPVEAAREDKLVVNYHKLIMHVVRRGVVSSTVDACISEFLNIRARVMHALIVRNDLNYDTSSVAFQDRSGQIIIRKIENTYL